MLAVYNNLIKLFAVLIIMFLPVTTAFAQDISDIENYFTIESSIGTQSPWTKSIPIHIKFRPHISADKVQIVWDAPDGVIIKKRHPDFYITDKDEVYEAKAIVVPKISGSYNIGVNIVAWKYNTNYTSSDSVSIRFGDNYVAEPETEGYRTAVAIRYVVILLISIGLIFLMVYGFKYGIKLLKKWLQPPD